MSRQKGGEEEEEEEESEEECFYESLDRIVSSSSTCTSSSSSSVVVSEDEENIISNKNQPIIPRFPISHYDVWMSQPTSIEERRQKLLQDMGLTTSGSSPDIDYGRSISSDQLQQGRVNSSTTTSSSSSNCAVARSKSDGADCKDSAPRDHCSNNSFSIPSASSNSIQSQSNDFSNSVVYNKKLLLFKSQRISNESIGGGSPAANGASSLSKPPSGRLSWKLDDINSNLGDAAHGGEESDDKLNTNGNVKDQEEVEELDPSCMIKNLDTGTEFVVNEVREDGLCDKVREVGTDRQLTLEEFERFVGHSPIVQELMRRHNVEEFDDGKDDLDMDKDGDGNPGLKTKKKGSWFKSIKKNVASVVTGQREKKSSDERDTSSEKGGRRSSSATDESQDGSFHGPERVRVRQYGKSFKDLTALFKSQEIQAHSGSIWSIKFSLDGRYLASAGEDCVIHVWQVVESERNGDFHEKLEDGILLNCLPSGSPEPALLLSNMESNSEKKRRGRKSSSRKSISLDQVKVPESVFALSEKPICSFRGHVDDVLDLSWSKSQLLLSSSMDKTVRLWHMASNSCLKIFSHSDYVTCIQFNPVDDRYFISGSLDAKVRIWSIPDRQVVDWNDLNEMVTAACYTPDGQGALVGSYKGSCRLYNTSENKLHPKSQINLQNKKKKSHHRKITGFQFAPGSSTEVLVTSADSRIRVIDGVDLVHKFKGFRNSSSQISASVTANGKYVVSASENSNVYVWKHEGESRPSRTKGVTVTQSYEHFHCQDVSVAIPWTGLVGTNGPQDENTGSLSLFSSVSSVNNHSTPALLLEANNKKEGSPSLYGRTNSPRHGTIASVSNSYFFDKFSATWPEEKLVSAAKKRSPNVSIDFSTGLKQGRSAWGMVIVTAGHRGEIRTFQNFGLPVRI